jgi:hypothetical protein
MFDMQGQQGDIARNANPVLTVDSINKKRNELFSVSNPIMMKPKPKPAPAPAPAPTPSPAPTSEGKEADNSESKGPESDAKAAEGSEVPMDV